MYRNRRLSVALTRTDRDADLIRYAALVARLGTAEEVRFVHVLPDGGTRNRAADLDRAAEEMWAAVRAREAGLMEAVRVSFDVLTGPAADRLFAHAADYRTDLLFVGQGGPARRLAMAAPCSVWVVPDGAPPAVNRVLVPIDFTERSADALRVACALAGRCGRAACLALHVHFNESRLTYAGEGVAVWEDQTRALLEFVAPFVRAGATVQPVFEEGADVAAAVGRVAEKHAADLVVMASRGRSRPAAVLRGSVTDSAVAAARTPLLVVKHFGTRLGLWDVLLDRRFWSGKEPQFN